MRCVIALLLVMCCTAAAIRGVQEKLLDRYLPDSSVFRCVESNVDIPMKFVNDEFCDCPDGSDEPGTSACSLEVQGNPTWRFQCTDKTYFVKEILHSHVNDNVCDCCDGSDEYLTGVACPNTCAQAHQQAEKERAEREEVRQRGLVARQSMVDQAKQRKDEMKREVEQSSSRKAELTASVTKAKEAVDTAEQAERQEREAIKAKSEAEYEVWKAEKAKATADTPVAETEAVAGNFKIFCSKWRQTKDCIGNGERQPDSDKDCEVKILDGWSGYCDCVDSETGAEIRHEFDCGHKPLTCSYVCTHEGEVDIAFPEEKQEEEFKKDDGSSYESPAAIAARQELRNAENELRDLENKIKTNEEQLAKDFGADDALLALVDNCFELEQREYTYKMCPFKEVQQMRKGSTFGPIMGRFKGFGEQSYSLWGSKQDMSHMIFSDGEHCWGGPNRSTDVHIVCGAENKLLSVEEPSMCTYKMVFQTPAACE